VRAHLFVVNMRVVTATGMDCAKVNRPSSPKLAGDLVCNDGRSSKTSNVIIDTATEKSTNALPPGPMKKGRRAALLFWKKVMMPRVSINCVLKSPYTFRTKPTRLSRSFKSVVCRSWIT